jgi:hypothetical protein
MGIFRPSPCKNLPREALFPLRPRFDQGERFQFDQCVLNEWLGLSSIDTFPPRIDETPRSQMADLKSNVTGAPEMKKTRRGFSQGRVGLRSKVSFKG